MANITQTFFILSFISILIITILKFKNVMNTNTDYHIKTSIILFVLSTISWSITFSSVMIENTELIIIILSRLSTILWSLCVLFMIIEIILTISSNTVKYVNERPTKRYNAKQNYFANNNTNSKKKSYIIEAEYR